MRQPLTELEECWRLLARLAASARPIPGGLQLEARSLLARHGWEPADWLEQSDSPAPAETQTPQGG